MHLNLDSFSKFHDSFSKVFEGIKCICDVLDEF